MSTRKKNCLVILGPTASGKTQLACELAFRMDAEIISADSRQVYKGLDIGTGKDLDVYQQFPVKIPYHLIDIVGPEEQFYLHQFSEMLRSTFEEIISRHKLPVICGGTGLYLDALQKDFSYTQIKEDPKLREKLQVLSKEELINKLETYDARHTEHVDRHSVKRLIRGIEVAEELSTNTDLKGKRDLPYHPLYIGVNKNIEDRKAAISKRLRKRLDHGLINEVERLLQNGLSHERLQMLGLEYKFVSYYLLGQITSEELFHKLETAIFQYAKRQMTWFRKMEKEGLAIHWIDPATEMKKLEDLLIEEGFSFQR